MLGTNLGNSPDKRNDFSGLVKNMLRETFLSARFLSGNYTEEKEVYKRPLAKFTQDIAKELGLLKDKL